MNWFEFLKACGLHEFSYTPKVIMLCSSTHPDNLRKASGLKVAEYMTTPLTAEKIKAMIERHFKDSNL